MLKSLTISGFKSFAKKTSLTFDSPITAIVGPNGSGKSNVVEALRFVLGEQSMKSLRGKGGADLIWKGSKILGGLSKAQVAIVFDNKKRNFSFSSSSGASAELGFDEITLVREVTKDGGSTYAINGTTVRLKDISDLLGSVHIGASGHHIISQGEADRLLSASAKDRRAMVEDALGLKVYQVRIKESERKLEKTAQNMKEVQALRRELAPHLKFLSKQVEKIQQAEELRKEFRSLVFEYVTKESGDIAHQLSVLTSREEETRKELSQVEELVSKESVPLFQEEEQTLRRLLAESESELSRKRQKRDELARSLGRIEGKLDALLLVPQEKSRNISPEEIDSLCKDIVGEIDTLVGYTSLEDIRGGLVALREKVITFAKQDTPKEEAPSLLENEIRAEKESVENALQALGNEITEAEKGVTDIRLKQSLLEEKRREAQKHSYEGIARKVALEGAIREQVLLREGLLRRKAILTDEVKEAEVLAGASFPFSFDTPVSLDETAKGELEVLHKKIERIKIRLEDAGGGSGSDVLREYEETQERDTFLANELKDLEGSIASLKTLIAELRDTIERTFKEGIEKINTQFGEFFKQMFNGGTAYLSVLVEHKRSREDYDGDGDEALPFEHGIEINVSLPHKKVRDLHMLSGGERSLVSIALLFAMSQVNPPPFLVLDETDAALDEANSRRYGDMLALLSKHSKLVVVTHNRETMSRAQVLYGVTMGVDGASKLLSIKFEEAVQIAK